MTKKEKQDLIDYVEDTARYAFRVANRLRALKEMIQE